MQPITRQTAFVERRQPSIRWSSVVAGAAVSIGLWIFFQVLGMGLGLAAIDTDDAGSLRGATLGTGVWALIAPILAMFAGGVVVARTSGLFDRLYSGLHGLMVWSITTVLGVIAMVMVLGALANAAATTSRMAAQGAGAVAGATAGAVNRVMVPIDSETMLGVINRKLREQGKPTVTADQLEAVGRDVIERALLERRFDRDLLIERITVRTALGKADADDVARQVEYQLAVARDRLDRAGAAAQHAALTAADRTGKAMVWAALSLLLSLGAAIGGAIFGTWWQRRDRGPGAAGRPEQHTQEMWTTRDTGTAPMGSGIVPP